MRVLICGDRHWIDIKAIENIILKLKYIATIIEGEAAGADSLSRVIAVKLNIPVQRYYADWLKYGKAAGMIRNKQMLDEGKPNIIIAFHDDIVNSKGTKNMLDIGIKAGIVCYLYTHEKGLNVYKEY